jgi:putative methyltransferase (TIGR04325 family)
MRIDQLTAYLKRFIPPVLLQLIRQSEKYGFFGDYKSWQEASRKCTGYDSSEILAKVKKSLLKVKKGEAVYERDSVIFDRAYYPFPLLASLLKIAFENDGYINILDFGGSLGSSYFQCKDFISVVKILRWNIVEQANFVACGKQYFEDESLKFYSTIEDCIQNENPYIILISSTLQYLEDPYLFLRTLVDFDFKYIVFDRTTFIDQGKDRLTIQKVPPEIYPASYPAWFFNLNKFLAFFQERYELVYQFNALSGIMQIKRSEAIAHDLGFFFIQKS